MAIPRTPLAASILVIGMLPIACTAAWKIATDTTASTMLVLALMAWMVVCTVAALAVLPPDHMWHSD